MSDFAVGGPHFGMQNCDSPGSSKFAKANVTSIKTRRLDEPGAGILGLVEYTDIDSPLETYAERDSIDTRKPTKLLFLLALVTSFCGFMFGYDTGYISSALLVMNRDLGKVLTSGDKELITSATSLGALIFAIFGGFLSDAFGRKWVISFANIMFIVGGAMQTGAHSLWLMIVGRFIMGWGVGLASLVAPLYLSELAPTRFRGRLVIMNVMAITIGQLVAYGIGAGLAHVRNGWRILVGLSLVPSTLQMVLFLYMPETPRFLIRENRLLEARKVLSQVYNGAGELELTNKIAEIQQDMPPQDKAIAKATATPFFRKVLLQTKHLTASYWSSTKKLFRYAANRRALAIVIGLQFFQQFSGWNALMYYSATIFQSVGFDNPATVSIIIAATNFAFTCVAFLIIDRIGRRALLVGTMWGMSLGLVMCAVAFHYLPFDIEEGSQDMGEKKWSVVVIVFIFVYAAFYATGIGNVPWQQSEMLPMEVRGIGTSLATATNWAGSLIISATFLTMMKSITPTGAFVFYAAICMVGEVLVILFYPETASLSLEEIHGLLEGGFQVRRSLKLSQSKKQHKISRTETQSEHSIDSRNTSRNNYTTEN